MKVYVVISGYAYDSGEKIEGVFLNIESAKEKERKVKASFTSTYRYAYVEECEVIE